MKHLLYDSLLWLLLCLVVVAYPSLEEDTDFIELPSDAHVSADPLPHELEDEFECTCDRAHQQSSRNAKTRIFYLVGIHNNRTLQDAIYLFRGIRDPRNTILFHLDVKLDFEVYQRSALRQELEACPCGSHVEVASVHNASWSTWSMNLPTLWAMEQAVRKYAGKWDVFINLSGDTLPVYTPDRISELFGGPLKGINFITSSSCETGLLPTPITAFPKWWHKRSHYSDHPASLDYADEDGTKHFNVKLTTYFGSQWMALLPDWCEYLVTQLKRPDSLPTKFRDYLIATKKLMTDETFIPTLIMHLRPETTPQVYEDYRLAISNDTDLEMYAIRYERMDEHVPNSKGWYPSEQRYEVTKSSGIEQPKPWGPYFLGVYDLLNIRESGALFVRKVATAIDHNLFEILPVDRPEDIPPIGWPREVDLSPKPNWQKKMAAMKENYLKKAQSTKVASGQTTKKKKPSINDDGDIADIEKNTVEGRPVKSDSLDSDDVEVRDSDEEEEDKTNGEKSNMSRGEQDIHDSGGIAETPESPGQGHVAKINSFESKEKENEHETEVDWRKGLRGEPYINRGGYIADPEVRAGERLPVKIDLFNNDQVKLIDGNEMKKEETEVARRNSLRGEPDINDVGDIADTKERAKEWRPINNDSFESNEEEILDSSEEKKEKTENEMRNGLSGELDINGNGSIADTQEGLLVRSDSFNNNVQEDSGSNKEKKQETERKGLKDQLDKNGSGSIAKRQVNVESDSLKNNEEVIGSDEEEEEDETEDETRNGSRDDDMGSYLPEELLPKVGAHDEMF